MLRGGIPRRPCGAPVLSEAPKAFVQSLDAQRHVVSGDANGSGGVEVGTWVRLRVGHETAERVTADGLLLAQRDHPADGRGGKKHTVVRLVRIKATSQSQF